MATRIFSIFVFYPLLLGAILWPGGNRPFPGWPCALFVAALAVVALRELYAASRRAGCTPREGIGLAATLLLLLPEAPPGPDSSAPAAAAFTALFMASLALEALRPDRAPLRSLPVTWLGALYVGGLFGFALRLRLYAPERLAWTPWPWMEFTAPGAWLLLFALLVANAVDTGAYLVGRTLGRHRLAPEVSPGKTWEGAAGGFVAGMLAAVALGAVLRLPLPFVLSAGALVGLLSQLGDLAKSAIKREVGLKDFGALIPGHGGVLDRFDSLLFAAPAVYWLLRL